jgi:hypothetical protein
VNAHRTSGYQLLSEAINLPAEYHYVRTRLEIEQARLLDWGRFIGISETECSLPIGRASRGAVLEVLEQQHDLLLKFGQYDNRLKPIQKPLLVELREGARDHKQEGSTVYLPHLQDLRLRALSYATTARSLPHRLRWVVCDKTKIEAFLCKLTAFNNFLMELLDRHQFDELLQIQARTNYGIMQLHSSLDQLVSILQAESLLGDQKPLSACRSKGGEVPSFQALASPCNLQMDPWPTALSSLARTKAYNLVAEEGRLTEPFVSDIGLERISGDMASVEVKSNLFQCINTSVRRGCELECPRTEAILPNDDNSADVKHVWIEWKFEPRKPVAHATPWSRSRTTTSTVTIETTNNRMAALAAMLRQSKSSDLFRTAYCVGFFYERAPHKFLQVDLSQRCYGIVFEKPAIRN